jgi:signal transduction histidine kinase
MTRTRVQWLAIGLPALLVGLFEFARHRWLHDPLGTLGGDVLAAVVVGLAVFGFVRYFTRVAAEAERALGRARAEAAVLAERQRIGREMHDGVAQALFLLRVRVDEAEERLAGGDVDAVREQLAAVRTQVAAAHAEVRAAIADLKRASTEEDTVEALRRDVTPVAAALGVELAMTVEDLPKLDAQGRQHLAAIVAEALSNAARHGAATRVTVAGSLGRLEIADNGRGLPAEGAARGGFGLDIMSERAQLIGGTLRVEPGDGQGARVVLTWSEEAA